MEHVFSALASEKFTENGGSDNAANATAIDR
jgi:hypothetical protein